MDRNLEKKRLCIRPVVDPDGYLEYEKVCHHIAKFYFTTDKAACDRALITAPRDSRFVTLHTILEVGKAGCPTYWIASDLLNALLQSQMQIEPENLHWAMKIGIVMVPNGLVQSPGGNSVQAILWHVTDKELYWVALCGNDFFCRRFALGGSREQFTDAENYDAKDIESFNNYLQSIFLRVMVLMEARPELIEKPAETIVVNKGFAKDKAKVLYQPQWIGRQYRFKTQSASGNGAHASPVMHWRRGFLRSQPYGEGRKQRKLVWIEPTLVMAATEIA